MGSWWFSVSPWWICIIFVWPRGCLKLPASSSQSECHLQFASNRLCQALLFIILIFRQVTQRENFPQPYAHCAYWQGLSDWSSQPALFLLSSPNLSRHGTSEHAPPHVRPKHAFLESSLKIVIFKKSEKKNPLPLAHCAYWQGLSDRSSQPALSLLSSPDLSRHGTSEHAPPHVRPKHA